MSGAVAYHTPAPRDATAVICSADAPSMPPIADAYASA